MLSIFEMNYLNAIETIENEYQLFESMCEYNILESLALSDEKKQKLKDIKIIIENAIDKCILYIEKIIKSIVEGVLNKKYIEENKRIIRMYKDLDTILFNKLRRFTCIDIKVFEDYKKNFDTCYKFLKVGYNESHYIQKINEKMGIKINTISEYKNSISKTIFKIKKEDYVKITNTNISNYADLLKEITNELKNTKNKLMQYKEEIKKEKININKNLLNESDADLISAANEKKKDLLAKFNIIKNITSSHITICMSIRREILSIFKYIINVTSQQENKEKEENS